jgi:hypothetical protein
MTPRGRRGTAIAVAIILAVAIAVVGVIHAGTGGSGTVTTTSPPTIPTTTNPYAAEEIRTVLAAKRAVNVTLPTGTGAVAPVLGGRPYRTSLGRHEVVGFVPYYELGGIDKMELADFTDVVYYAVDLKPNGLLDEAGSSTGWSDLQDGGAGNLVTSGHTAHDRVLLSVFSQSPGVLATLAAHPGDGTRLADELAPLLSQFGFDGIDLDFEGEAGADRAGFVSYVAALSSRLRRLDPSWTIMLNTFPQSAEDTSGFLDVQALARYVDVLFVMAYDMTDNEIPSANAPLTGASLTVADALASYAAAGLAGKTILGTPFYGYDFPSQGSSVGAQASGQPYAVTYDAILASIVHDGHKPLWDPASIALKTALAAQFHIAGVGAWELGMVQQAPQMITVLTGGSPVVKLPLATQP